MKINEVTGRITKTDATTGIEITNPDNTKIIIPPEKMAQLAPDPMTPGKYVMNKDVLAMQTNKLVPPKLGGEVTIKDSPIEEEPVDEKMDFHFAGAAVGHKEGVPGQWRNKGPKKDRPAKAGDLVGGAEESFNTDDDLLEKMLTIANLK
jgi:hypothetical protein